MTTLGSSRFSDSLVNSLTQVAGVMSAANTAANAGAAIGSIANLITDYSGSGKEVIEWVLLVRNGVSIEMCVSVFNL